MEVRFELREFGTSFATRERGAEVREELLRRAGDADRVVVDLAEVQHVSYSFADELLGKLSAADNFSLDLEGASPNLDRTIQTAISRRAPAAVSG